MQESCICKTSKKSVLGRRYGTYKCPEAGMSLVYSRNGKLGSCGQSKRAGGRRDCDELWQVDGGPYREAQDPSGPCSSAPLALTLIRTIQHSLQVLAYAYFFLL